MSSTASARRRAPSTPIGGSAPAGLAAAALVAAAALFVAWKTGVKGVSGVPPDAAGRRRDRGPVRPPGVRAGRALRSRDSLRTHLPLFVLPLGACASALGLTVLCFAQVPLPVALVVVIAAGAAGSVMAWRRHGPTPPARACPGWPGRPGWPW